MFFKDEPSLFEQFLEQAKQLANECKTLQKQIKNVFDSSKYSSEYDSMVNSSKKKLTDEVLKKEGFWKTKEEKEKLISELKERQSEIVYEFMTEVRDLGFKRYCNDAKRLHTLGSMIQSLIIKTLELKQEAHDRPVLIRSGNLTKKISEIVDDELLDLVNELMKSYQTLDFSMQVSHADLFMTFGVVPPENPKTDTEKFVYNMIYRKRVAMYKDTEAYQLFKAFVENTKNTHIMNSFNQFMETNPNSRHLSKSLLNKIVPLIELIDNIHGEILKRNETSVDWMEENRNQDVKDFMNMKI